MMMRLAAIVSIGAVIGTAGAVAEIFRSDSGSDTSLMSGRLIALGGSVTQAQPPCAQCHGLDGRGHGPFPSLAGQGSWYLYKTLRDYASGRRQSSVMQPYARQLSDTETQAVARYYASLPPPPAVEKVGHADKRQEGGAISAAGLPGVGVPACATCHGPRGQGMPPIYPSLAGQPAAYLANQLHAWKRGERGGDPLNVMREISRAMSDAQIEAVASYFASTSLRSEAAALQSQNTERPVGSRAANPEIQDAPRPPYLTREPAKGAAEPSAPR